MFPEYTRKERIADGAVHLLGLGASVAAVAVLLDLVIRTRDAASIAAATIYGAGLTAMFALSAAYNLVGRPDWKEAIRRFDHAAIFLMIAGSYTPFALVSIGGAVGSGLLAAVWLAAVTGMVLKLVWPRRFERESVFLYLALGWAGLPAVHALFAALPTSALALLGIGGLLYTAGVVFHLWETLPHHNAIWHSFVAAGAGCHFVAVLEALVSL